MANDTARQESGNLTELENGDLRKLILKFCIPSLISSLVTSVYNIVDQLFIGNAVGMLGNAATNVVFPISTLLTALSLMIGVGASAAFNLSMGRQLLQEARKIIGNGFFLMVSLGLIITIIVLGWTEPVLYFLGCTEEIYPYAAVYARIISLGYALAIIGAAGPFILRADGSPRYALIATVTGSILNIFLDAIFVLVFHWGIAGAAWATVISQLVSAGMVLVYLPRFKTFALPLRDFLPEWRTAAHLSALGAGPAFNFLTQAFVALVLNHALRVYGAASVYGAEVTLAVAGVANKVNTIASAVVQGFTNGMQPIVSYNYGKKNFMRVRETVLTVVRWVLMIGAAIFLCYQLIPRQITALFGPGSELYFDFAAKYFRIYLMLIMLNGLQSSICGFFSAEGKPGRSILISLIRQVIFLPPLLLILPSFCGLNGVLAAGPISDAAMAIAAVILLRREFRNLM